MGNNKQLLANQCTLSIMYTDGDSYTEEQVRNVYLIDNTILTFRSDMGFHYIPVVNVYEWNIKV